ncbi:putative undecaprenyl-diphosphatase YbjG [Lentilactobacillus sunkii]|jgi:undecaprenyl-diphosphatase|uniref:Putative undecaprenyl-diphosphatase YbjG n=1 Tax=Lentilactobacillus sunkii TaxID=481719 RepID=A0A1E7XEG9_9LACO|nr:phosphatase PAP2 family protein [Lentilactobacillus sunkii]OFA11418.1 putative undecaprenyl-diphosphatase YbjG [Lentilactobacillus sunkii]
MRIETFTRHPYITIGWAAFLTLAITVVVRLPQLILLDMQALEYVHRFITPQRTEIFKVITFSGSPAVTISIVLILAIILWKKKMIYEALITITTAVTGNVACLFVKFIVQRPRPTTMITPASGFSFPSGHVVGSVILVFAIVEFGFQIISSIRLKVSLTMIMAFWLAMVAISRVYFQVHYPVDVFGGGLFSLLWCETVLAAFRQKQVDLTELIHDKRGITHDL